MDKAKLREIDRNKAAGGWVGGRWGVRNESRGYHGLLVSWWRVCGLSGRVLLVGEKGIFAQNVKEKLLKEFPKITEVVSVDFTDADIIWDVTKPFPDWDEGFDFIICQSVLEHLSAPALAMINMLDVLKIGGYLFVHTCTPSFKYHPFPIDCCRYFKDAFVEWAKLTSSELVDICYNEPHILGLFKKLGFSRYMITYIEDNLALRYYQPPM